ncbi:MAG TPA: adenosylhomocysteinase [Nitrososphaeraceae archaeon]|nr:adenosylhomocysteinase [Nitrososphaeraceae archaeon]
MKDMKIDSGRKSWEWASSHMGIMSAIVNEHMNNKPLRGLRLGLSLHITKETSVLVTAAIKLGSKVSLCSANPLSVQEDIVAFLSSLGVKVYAWKDETEREYSDNLERVLENNPHIITDDGANLHVMAHKNKVFGILGGTEETTSGITRLKALEKEGKLQYPVIGVNEARTKHLFDNRYGTGQSTLTGIIRLTNVLIAGKHIVVCGYGHVGRGVAARARGMGAVVTIVEVDALKALEAYMDGYGVKKIDQVLQNADIIITCTGQKNVIAEKHFKKMKNGTILANAGHFDNEIEVEKLFANSNDNHSIKQYLDCFNMNGRKIFLLAKGRVVNLVGGEGNPPEVMAMSFANQLLSILHIFQNHKRMQKKVFSVPEKIDSSVAKLSLKYLQISIDKLNSDQIEYAKSY